jgi:hypothetical protein
MAKKKKLPLWFVVHDDQYHTSWVRSPPLEGHLMYHVFAEK